MKKDFLSKRDRNNSLKLYHKHIFFNGMGYTFLTETIIFLMAIKLGATNTQLGYLASVIPLTGAVMILTPTLFAGFKITKIFYFIWIIRGMLALLYLAAFILFLNNMKAQALSVVIISYTTFALLRNLAWPLKQTIEGILVKTKVAGQSVAGFSMMLNQSKLLANGISFLLLSIKQLSGLAGLVTLELFGIIMNTISASYLRKMPIESTIQKQTDKSILQSFKQSCASAKSRVILLLFWCNVIITVLFSFTVPLFKKTADMPDNIIFVYSLLASIAAIAAGKAIKPFSDRMGSRPLLFIGCGAMIMMSIFWTYIKPDQLSTTILISAGVISIFFITALFILISRLILHILPPDDRIGFTSILYCFAALFALSAALLSGKLADQALSLKLGLPHIYSLGYAGMGLTALAMLLIVKFWLKEQLSMSLPEAFSLMTSPAKFKTFMNIEKLPKINNKHKRDMILLELTHSSNSMATNEIKQQLQSPMIRQKEELLRSLFFNPRPELLDNIIDEAADCDSWWRETALFVLGAYQNKRAETALKAVFENETYPYMRSIAAKSLARIGCTDYQNEITAMYKNPKNSIRTVVNAFIARSIIDKKGRYLHDIFNIIHVKKSPKFHCHIYIIIGHRLGLQPELENFFYQARLDQQNIDELLEHAAEIPAIAAIISEIKELIAANRLNAVYAKMSKLLKDAQIVEPLENLRLGLLKPFDNPNLEDTIAFIFFNWQILSAREKIEKSGSISRTKFY
jgi:hypothetical protein